MSLAERRDANEFANARKQSKARIDFRPKPALKALFEQAATLEGQSLSEFLIRSAEERARRVLAEHEAIKLRSRASERFLELLTNAPSPTERLRAAFRRHDDEVESR